ncbi:hypothetical protein CBR_g66694 [Chara braunii]|nr:hypothetical protein CBR_g66694 [Chara braunii]|eukprot:GBG59889.1 hypothetical protein CBR_g66694 [Chara braunii]
MLDDISTFATPATINEQLDTLKTEVWQLHQLPDKDGNTSAQQYKMPTFRIEKFDDYTHEDPVPWWQGFTTELRSHNVPEHSYIGALFLNSKGGCQIWLSHLATIHGVQVADLHKKISWEDLKRQWKKRFIIDDAATLAINRLFSMAQGNTPTCDWLTEWQKIVATPNLDLPFPHLGREFYNRSCATLNLALGDREQYTTFAEIIDKAREIIKTNRTAAHEKSAWQPAHVEKGKFGPHPQQVAAVQPDNIAEDPAATPASREGDQPKFGRARGAHAHCFGPTTTSQVQSQPRQMRIRAARARVLGHYVTSQGIRPLAYKIKAICVWPEPTNTMDIRSFMGLAGYYQCFITGYSRIVAPLMRLQSPKVPFVSNDDARWSFQALKTTMLMAPVLSIYDPTLPTRVTTAASGYGIGAILEQHDGGDWHPVEYFSHKVHPINSLDDARKKELLAFVMALK